MYSNAERAKSQAGNLLVTALLRVADQRRKPSRPLTRVCCRHCGQPGDRRYQLVCAWCGQLLPAS